jgi:hypothetical protein
MPKQYTALTTQELADELVHHAAMAPIDMTFVAISLRSLEHCLRHSDADKARELRLIAIGQLMLADELALDIARKPVPRAEDGDVIFANRSWVPGKRFDELRDDLAIAARQAQRQLADALKRAGLADLAAHDHRRDMRDELETQLENEAIP